MKQADRDASVFELVLRCICDIRKETPDLLSHYEGITSIDTLIGQATNALGNESEYEACIKILMIAGMCHKYLYDLMQDADIQHALIESSCYGDHRNENRKSTLQRNPSDLQSKGNSNN